MLATPRDTIMIQTQRCDILMAQVPHYQDPLQGQDCRLDHLCKMYSIKLLPTDRLHLAVIRESQREEIEVRSSPLALLCVRRSQTDLAEIGLCTHRHHRCSTPIFFFELPRGPGAGPPKLDGMLANSGIVPSQLLRNIAARGGSRRYTPPHVLLPLCSSFRQSRRASLAIAPAASSVLFISYEVTVGARGQQGLAACDVAQPGVPTPTR